MSRNKNYDALVERGRHKHGDKFDTSDLDARFIEFYGTETRLKIDDHGTIIHGRVGVTTGWKPTFILMRRSSDRGSSWTLGPNQKILAVKWPGSSRYVEVAGVR